MASAAPFPIPTAERVREIIAGQLLELPDNFNESSNLFEAGLDSMAIMQLLLILEENFGVIIPMGEVTHDNFSTTKGIVELVASKQSEAAG
jgi:acyl carrier protein